MKKNNILCLLLCFVTATAAAQSEPVVSEEMVRLSYFNDNGLQYLVVYNYIKTGKKQTPLKNKTFELYLDSSSAFNHIAKVTTGANGKAQAYLAASLKESWNAAPTHTFFALAPGKEEKAAELEITRSKITIDTATEDGIKNIKVNVLKYDKGEWTPANEVEIKAGIRRHGGILSGGEQESYTTDSTGMVSVAINKDKMPGDAKGNIILVAKVEDNDLYGNMLIEKKVPWGVAVKADNSFFNQRALWSTRFRTPFWLLFMAFSMVIGVWGVLCYLVIQLIKIKKLGNESDDKRRETVFQNVPDTGSIAG